jgi:hypothetical protein
MKNLIKTTVGSFTVLNYTGEMKHFGQTLAEAAKTDPQLEQQILFAANEMKYLQWSRNKGDEMIDVILNPQNN